MAHRYSMLNRKGRMFSKALRAKAKLRVRRYRFRRRVSVQLRLRRVRRDIKRRISWGAENYTNNWLFCHLSSLRCATTNTKGNVVSAYLDVYHKTRAATRLAIKDQAPYITRHKRRVFARNVFAQDIFAPFLSRPGFKWLRFRAAKQQLTILRAPKKYNMLAYLISVLKGSHGSIFTNSAYLRLLGLMPLAYLANASTNLNNRYTPYLYKSNFALKFSRLGSLDY